MKYIAPETISGKKYNRMIDWWSLGIILYRMLTASLPHPTNINKKIPYYIVNYKLPLDKSLLSKNAYDLVYRLLERDPEKRIGLNGADEIKAHKFFSHINWKKLAERKVKPPFIPAEKLVIPGKIFKIKN
jgi:serum/glucocorticoid-regulated kinase 2